MKRLLFAFVLLLAGHAFAQDVQDPIEKKAQVLDKKLIAPCCWTSTLDQHFSQEAEDMKTEIRQRLAQGQPNEQILEYFEKKYGERILSEPKKAGFNLTVWIFPFFAIGFGVFLLLKFLTRPKTKTSVFEDETAKPSKPVTSAQDEKYRKMIEQELYRE